METKNSETIYLCTEPVPFYTDHTGGCNVGVIKIDSVFIGTGTSLNGYIEILVPEYSEISLAECGHKKSLTFWVSKTENYKSCGRYFVRYLESNAFFDHLSKDKITRFDTHESAVLAARELDYKVCQILYCGNLILTVKSTLVDKVPFVQESDYTETFYNTSKTILELKNDFDTMTRDVANAYGYLIKGDWYECMELLADYCDDADYEIEEEYWYE